MSWSRTWRITKMRDYGDKWSDEIKDRAMLEQPKEEFERKILKKKFTFLKENERKADHRTPSLGMWKERCKNKVSPTAPSKQLQKTEVG